MSPEDNRPPKGASAIKNWLRGYSARTQLQGDPIVQTSPIFQLPDEIFVNVFSNFPTLQLECAYYRVDQHSRLATETRYFSRTYGARHRVLLVFTQLCRSTRQKFLPWLWEHVQSLCVYPPGPDEECRQLAKKIFRGQSRTLAAAPSLAVHVRRFSVHIFRSNAAEIAKLLPLLPNLDTLEVLTEDYEESSIKRPFKSIRLPQIRTLVIDAYGHYLMRSCTNVERLIIHQRGFDTTYLRSIPFVAASLVYLALCLPAPEIIQDLVRLCPDLEELAIVQPYSFQLTHCITVARGFKKLRLLEVALSCRLEFYSSSLRPIGESQMKEHAVTILEKIHGHTKVLKVISVDSFSRWDDIRDIETRIITVP